MRLLLAALLLLPTAALANWNSVSAPKEESFSWTAPLWPSFWMAWTPVTFALFCGIFGAMALIATLEITRYRDGVERRGVFGLTTTLGDRLFITLLGTAYIFLAWLGLFGQPVWAPLGISIAWGLFVFWKV
ncbi:hypothetical protein EI983_04555 [Roseovarius faecimaris]|uniref:Glycerol-3-phosphate ABC transporter n=1 Tax=Roseovarius faecimaris TaxID=2494550 RepID=A0A6I6IY49_9RHOB|nr:DUF2160 domain-containing protein [Roseovarius faecimaris]QGX97588.1 hypothetical protein EI983_04555 [Roseovarius faecimaris]